MNPEERAAFVQDVAAAIKTQEPVLSQDEQQWVRLAIRKEAQSIKLRQALIEKTLAGLVWAGLIALAVIFKDYATTHGWKP